MSGRATLRVAVLGVNAGFVVLLWPLWVAPGTDGGAELGVTLAAGVLGAGTLALVASARRIAAYLLLGAFPVALVAGVALRPEALNAQAYDATALVLAMGSFLAFGASAAVACADLPKTLPVRTFPLSDAPTLASPTRSTWLRTALVTIVASGAAAIAILAPTQGGLAALERDWEGAALEGGLLAAVVGTAVAVALVAVFLPSAWRRPSAPLDTFAERAPRIVAFLLAALLGAASWLALRP